MSKFVVQFQVDGEVHTVTVESKDTINAAIDAIWPVTVWPEEDWIKQTGKALPPMRGV